MTDKIILSFGRHTVRIKLSLKENNIAILSVDTFVMKEWYGTQVIDLILSWGGACRRNFGRTKPSLPGTVSLGNRKPRHNKCQVTSLYGARFLQIRQPLLKALLHLPHQKSIISSHTPSLWLSCRTACPGRILHHG